MAKLIGKKKYDVDMTEGSISRHILSFSIPLLVGNLFQILYNTVDTWVVGNFASDAAFSAVGTVGPALNMMIAFAMGLGSGAGIVISQYYGAKQYDNVSKAVHTTIVAGAVLGLILSITGCLLLPTLLKFMNVPDEIYADARTYLLILYAAMIPPALYNMGAGVLRAVGDSSRPFYFLLVSCVTNIILDLLFVIKFNWGVAGVAWATTAAQTLSMVLVLITLLRSDACIKLIPKKLAIDKQILKKIIRVGIPSAIQMTITSFSNLFVQSYINAFGGSVMGGWTAYTKVGQFLQLPIQTLATALSTFTGQNLGKGQTERAKRSVVVTLYMSIGFCIGAGALVMLAAPTLSNIFNSNPEIIHYGTYFLRHIVPVYFLMAIYQTIAAALRGAGNAKIPMFAMLGGGVVFRQVYLFVFSRIFPGNILPVTYAYPVGWAMAGLILVIYYKKADLGKTRLVD
ncbi:MAG: MATE family efflux transporter [Firmicutes bacterium]|nr:MATE family efflux transporter [Bacillota bacterium]